MGLIDSCAYPTQWASASTVLPRRALTRPFEVEWSDTVPYLSCHDSRWLQLFPRATLTGQSSLWKCEKDFPLAILRCAMQRGAFLRCVMQRDAFFEMCHATRRITTFLLGQSFVLFVKKPCYFVGDRWTCFPAREKSLFQTLLKALCAVLSSHLLKSSSIPVRSENTSRLQAKPLCLSACCGF